MLVGVAGARLVGGLLLLSGLGAFKGITNPHFDQRLSGHSKKVCFAIQSAPHPHGKVNIDTFLFLPRSKHLGVRKKS
jgi:hypothetical protein